MLEGAIRFEPTLIADTGFLACAKKKELSACHWQKTRRCTRLERGDRHWNEVRYAGISTTGCIHWNEDGYLFISKVNSDHSRVGKAVGMSLAENKMMHRQWTILDSLRIET